MLTKIWTVDNTVENLYTYPQIIEAAEVLQKMKWWHFRQKRCMA